MNKGLIQHIRHLLSGLFLQSRKTAVIPGRIIKSHRLIQHMRSHSVLKAVVPDPASVFRQTFRQTTAVSTIHVIRKDPHPLTCLLLLRQDLFFPASLLLPCSELPLCDPGIVSKQETGHLRRFFREILLLSGKIHFMQTTSHHGSAQPVFSPLQPLLPVQREHSAVCHRAEHAGISRIIHQPFLNGQQLIHIQRQDFFRFPQVTQLFSLFQKQLRDTGGSFPAADALPGPACHQNPAAVYLHFRKEQERAQRLGSRRFPENGDTVRIASKGFDIFMDPFQSGKLVQRSVIARMPEFLSQYLPQIEIAQRTQPIFHGNEKKAVIPDHPLSLPVPAASILKRAAMQPHGCRKFLRRRAFRMDLLIFQCAAGHIEIQIQAILPVIFSLSRLSAGGLNRCLAETVRFPYAVPTILLGRPETGRFCVRNAAKTVQTSLPSSFHDTASGPYPPGFPPFFFLPVLFLSFHIYPLQCSL